MPQFPANIDLSTLNGSNGFRIGGSAASDVSGYSVASAGDLNGDGFDDIIVSSPGADPHGNSSGASYVVFGKASGFASSFDLGSLDGRNGFRLSGELAGDLAGTSVASAGDVNGDGRPDLIIGAIGADPNGNFSGTSYVVFGTASGFGPNLDLSGLDGSNGFKIHGGAGGSFSGLSVASGDVNNDGHTDLIVAANSNYNGAFVVFGGASGFAPSLSLANLDEEDGFRINAGANSVASGDVNGDGFADVIVGDGSASPDGTTVPGAAYVVFGKAGGFAATADVSALDGANGFRLLGATNDDRTGASVAVAGDINGDGFADIIIGAPRADPNGNYSGAAYVVFGKASGFASSIDLAALDGANGFKLNGVSAESRAGRSVGSAGDVNGDGFDDLVVAANPYGDVPGTTYVVFGHASGFAAGIELSDLDGSNGFSISGAISISNGDRTVASAGDVNGDGFADLVVGAGGEDTDGGNAGASYVVFGRMPTAAVARIGTDVSQTLAGGNFRDLLAGMGGGDQLYGHGGNDTLDGGDGNDVLRGGTGDDAMNGGAGDDTYYADSSEDVAVEFANGGTDTVRTTASFALGQHVENLIAHSDAGLTLKGNGLANTITGGDGNDTLNGGGGADAMNGGAGDDRYFINSAGDTVTDSSGLDSITTTIDHSLGAGFERLYARSDAGLILTGNGANNVIVGRGGNDTITGGGGRDVMAGGASGDTFVFQALSDSLVGGQRDVIRDFVAGVDKTDLTQIDADAGLAGDQAFGFIGSAAFSHTAGELQAKTLGANTLVSGDVDGNGQADFQILLRGHVALQATDFLL
jgi:Ca2+-binding RTX toxin-like protein